MTFPSSPPNPNDNHDDLIPLPFRADELLNPVGDLAPRSTVAMHATVRLWAEFAERHNLEPSLRQLHRDDLAAFIYERVFLAGLTCQTGHTYLSRLMQAYRAVNGEDPSVDRAARRVLRAATRLGHDRPRQPAAVIPLWLLLETLDQMQAGLPGYPDVRSTPGGGRWLAARDRALFAVMYAAALRPSEVLNVTTSDIVRRDGGYVLQVINTKTPNGRAAHVFIADDDVLGTGRLVHDWLEMRGDLDDDGLFPGTHHGIPLSLDRASMRFRAAAARCGHTQGAISLYSLRRTAATLAWLTNASPETLQGWLRHQASATTSLYLDQLAHLADPDRIRSFYLARTRPEDADPNDLGERGPKPAGPTPATSVEAVPIGELRERAKAAAATHAGSTSQTATAAARVYRRWESFCQQLQVDVEQATGEQLLAWVVALHRDGLAPATIETYLSYLSTTADNDGRHVPESRRARRAVEGLRRQPREATRRAAAHAVHRREQLVELAERFADPTNTDDLDRIVLRWWAAQQGVRLTGPLRRDEVTVSDRHVTLLHDGGRIELAAHPDPSRCPVQATVRRLAASDGPILIERWKVNAGRLHSRGLHARIEGFDADQFDLASWVYATPLRRHRRARLLISVAWAGTLTILELAGVRIEDLVRTDDGYEFTLTSGKQRGGYRISLSATGDPLCPVDAIDRWLPICRHDAGPLLAARIDHHSLNGPHPHATQGTIGPVLDLLRRESGMDLDGETFRRSRAIHEWEEHGDLPAVRRLLRHPEVDQTRRLLRDHAPYGPVLDGLVDDDPDEDGPDDGPGDDRLVDDDPDDRA